MKKQGKTLSDAIIEVKKLRPQILPNPGFLQQLRRWEAVLKGNESVVL